MQQLDYVSPFPSVSKNQQSVVKPILHQTSNDSPQVVSIIEKMPRNTPSAVIHPLIHAPEVAVVELVDAHGKTGNILEIKTVHQQNQRYWKINFIVVLLPLLLWGIPIHLVLFGRRGINSSKNWFKQIFLRDPIPVRLLTYTFFLIGLGLNVYFFYLSGSLLYYLLIIGKVRFNLFQDVVNVLRIAPLLAPLDFVWIWGYHVRKLILSFDRVTYPEVEVLQLQLQISSNSKMNVRPHQRLTTTPSYRCRLLGFYTIILVVQSIKLLITMEKSEKWVEEVATNNWIDFALNFLYNLMLPIYILVCWSIQFEFQRLSQYIKSLIAYKIHPNLKYFAEIKKCYKHIGDHVMQANDICSWYFSWVLFVLFGSLFDEGIEVLWVILEAFLLGVLGFNWSGSDLSPLDIRLFIGNFFVICSQIIILGIIIWSCITANDQARNLHVRLNDFVTEPHVTLTPELQQKFHLLKNYIHSRMESERPALLSIPIISFIPYCQCTYKWMVSYNVRH